MKLRLTLNQGSQLSKIINTGIQLRPFLLSPTAFMPA